MKALRHYQTLWLACVMLALAGCQTLGVPTPQTFGERLAAGYTTVSGIRETALILARAERISLADAENIQSQADNARAGLDIARTIREQNPEAADQRLTAILTALQALDAYLATRKL